MFLELFPNLEIMTLEGWLDSLTPSDLVTKSYYRLGCELQWAPMILEIVRASGVHIFIVRWSSGAATGTSVHFTRRAGSTEEFDREIFYTRMPANEKGSVLAQA